MKAIARKATCSPSSRAFAAFKAVQGSSINVPVKLSRSTRDASCSGTAERDAAPAMANRRTLLSGATLAALLAAGSGPAAAAEWLGVDLARKIIRPSENTLTDEQAVVVLMDARSVLRDIKKLAATSEDSQERFEARKLWPGFAKRLRDVGPAAPIVAKLITGKEDVEETLSELYGGKAGAVGVADAVYVGLGKVLTISGRTIRPEAQASPDAAGEAEAAIDAFLAKVPQNLLDSAQAFRVKRAEAVAAKGGA